MPLPSPLDVRVAQAQKLCGYQQLMRGGADLAELAPLRYARGGARVAYAPDYQVRDGAFVPNFIQLPARLAVILPTGIYTVDARLRLRKVPQAELPLRVDAEVSVCDFSQYVPTPSVVARRIVYCPLRYLVALAQGLLGCAQPVCFTLQRTYYVRPRLFGSPRLPGVGQVFGDLQGYEEALQYEGAGEPIEGAQPLAQEQLEDLAALAACVLAQGA